MRRICLRRFLNSANWWRTLLTVTLFRVSAMLTPHDPSNSHTLGPKKFRRFDVCRPWHPPEQTGGSSDYEMEGSIKKSWGPLGGGIVRSIYSIKIVLWNYGGRTFSLQTPITQCIHSNSSFCWMWHWGQLFSLPIKKFRWYRLHRGPTTEL